MTSSSKTARAKTSPTKKTTAARKTAKPKQPAATKTPARTKAATGLAVGKKAPAFSLLDDKGKRVKLSDFKGKNVVLFFYPKDNTPGCTTEACAFRDGLSAMKKRGAVVVGVSADSVESHAKFVKKFDFNFPLLSDEDKTMLQAYGVWKEKSLYGRKFMGIERTTFIIDEKGVITAIFPKVKVKQHYDEVLEALG